MVTPLTSGLWEGFGDGERDDDRFGVGDNLGIRDGDGVEEGGVVGADLIVGIGAGMLTGALTGQVHVGLYVPSQQICLPTLESQPQTPPCQEQHPYLAKTCLENKKATKEVAITKGKNVLDQEFILVNYNILFS